MFVSGGLVGPKLRPKGVGDGQTVNIPLLVLEYIDGATKFDRLSVRMVGRLSHKLVPVGKSAGALRRVVGDSSFGEKSAALSFQENPLKLSRSIRTANRHW